jgi:hypothetical protein
MSRRSSRATSRPSFADRPGGAGIIVEDFKIQLRNAKGLVTQANLTHVCPNRNGLKDICKLCAGPGWVMAYTFRLFQDGKLEGVKQLIADRRQQPAGRVRVALLDCARELGDVGH